MTATLEPTEVLEPFESPDCLDMVPIPVRPRITWPAVKCHYPLRQIPHHDDAFPEPAPKARYRTPRGIPRGEIQYLRARPQEIHMPKREDW